MATRILNSPGLYSQHCNASALFFPEIGFHHVHNVEHFQVLHSEILKISVSNSCFLQLCNANSYCG